LFFKISGENIDLIFDSFCSMFSIFISCFSVSIASTFIAFSSLECVVFSLAVTIKRRISFLDFQANSFKVV